MATRSKRRTASERLNLLLKRPDLQSLSAVLHSLPAEVAAAVTKEVPQIALGQQSKIRAMEHEIFETQSKAVETYMRAVEKLIELEANTKDEHEKKEIQRRIAEYPLTDNTNVQNSTNTLTDWLTTKLTSENYIRNVMAATAIDARFMPKAYEEAIDAAFATFNLDRANPLSWRALLGLLAWTHFDDPRKKGRPPTWSAERYCLLLEHVDIIKARSPIRLSDYRACELLKASEFKVHWKGQSAKRLDGSLKEARDPFKNHALVGLVHRDGMATKNDALTSGVELSPEEEAALIKKLSRKHADAIAKRWRQTQV